MDDNEQKEPASANLPESPDSCYKIWKPEPIIEAELTPLGFRFSLGMTQPPRKPDDEPLQ
jgi:hypothetical protein